MRINAREVVLSVCFASIGKRTPRDAARDAAELCSLANSLSRLNEIACNSGLTERQERREQSPQAQIKAVLKGGSTAPGLQTRKVCVCRLARAPLHFRLN
jgi:hypothetical protein